MRAKKIFLNAILALVATVFAALVFSCKTEEAVVLERIELSGTYKTQYFIGEPEDFTGLVVNVYYSNGTVEQVADYTISGFDSATSGKKEITVTWKEKSATFTVDVIEIELVKIDLDVSAVKTEFLSGEIFTAAGLKVTGTNNNSTIFETSDYEISILENTLLEKIGSYTVTVSYGGKTAEYSIEVKGDPLSGIEVTVPDYTNREISLVYENGTFTAEEGFASYRWMLDGELVSETSNSYTPDMTQAGTRSHSVFVLVTDSDGNSYSASSFFVVGQ